MLISLIVGIILAILSALSYIAYKFPNTYSFLLNYILWPLILASYVALYSYNFAFQLLELNIPYNYDDKLIRELIESLKVSWLLINIPFILLLSYFYLLHKIHNIINYFGDKEPDQEGNNKKSDN
jgi:hypothetical protein